MTKLEGWKTMLATFVICTATAIAAPAQVFKTLVNFDWTDGSNPLDVSLAQGRDGNLYGTTATGGANVGKGVDDGTIFRITRKGELTTLHSFSDNEGVAPPAGLVLSTDGYFYGTATYGGLPCSSPGCGTVFRVTSQGTLTTLHSFNSYDGAFPSCGLIQATDGNFYGTTSGASDSGTVFRITSEGVLTTLHSFNSYDGAFPSGGLIQATDGNFYGTTREGGTSDFGTVFKITREGVLTTLHSFASTDGANPAAGLIQARDGNFYGTTTGGGDPGCHAPDGCGTVFKISSAGKLTTLYTFGGGDGASPTGSLVQATDGSLYGTTSRGGTGYGYCDVDTPGRGTLFRITLSGTFTKLHDFCAEGNCIDGCIPYGGLVQATDGKFYGTTYGDSNNLGTVFSLDMGLGTFVTFVRFAGKVGQTGPILGQGFTGTSSVELNGTPADFNVISDTDIRTTVPAGASTGYVTVTTPSGTLKSNVPFHVIP